MIALLLLVVVFPVLLAAVVLVATVIASLACKRQNRREKAQHERDLVAWDASDQRAPPPRPPVTWVVR